MAACVWIMHDSLSFVIIPRNYTEVIMIGKVLIALTLAVFIALVSIKANAEEKTYKQTDVVCATLAFNAGYEEKGAYYAAKVDPYWEANKQAIMRISSRVVSDLGEQAMMEGKTLPYVARIVFNKYCNRPFI